MDASALRDFVVNVSPLKILGAMAVLALAWLATRLLALLFERLSTRFTRHRLHLGRVYPLARLAIWIFATGFAAFRVLRPPESVVLALAASSGIAIGFGAQDLLRNAWAGGYMLFDRPFGVGDMIRVGEHYGEVLSIGLNFTRLRTFEDSVVTVPNGEVVKQAVVNSNAGEISELVAVDLDVPASLPPGTVRSIAREAAATSPYTFLKRPIIVIVSDHHDLRALTRLTVKAYVVDIRLERKLAGDIVERFKRTLIERHLLDGTDGRQGSIL